MKNLFVTLIRAMVVFVLFFGHIIGGSYLMGQDPQNDPTICIEATADNFDVTFADLPHVAVSGNWDLSNHPFLPTVGDANDPIRIDNDIIVPIDVNLTIQNLHFEFGTHGRIVVRKGNLINNGGVLSVDNCNLSGDPTCNTMWQGIQVHGPGSVSAHLAHNSGLVVLKNSVVKHALIGLAATEFPAFDFSSISLFDWASINPYTTIMASVMQQYHWNVLAIWHGGGRIDVDNTTFIDCYEGIDVSWHYENTSSVNKIKNCHFIAVGNLPYPFSFSPNIPAPVQTEIGIGALRTERITAATSPISDCTFTGVKYGVRANNVVLQNYVGNNFVNCEVGISSRWIGALSSLALQDYAIESNTFTDCQVAIQGDGITASIYHNTISRTAWGNLSLGILLRGCEFDISNNAVPMYGNTITNTTYGVLVIDSDEDGGVVRNTIFNNNAVPVFVAGNNDGVEIGCNDFNNYSSTGAAIALTPWTNSGEIGVLEDQGDCNPDAFAPAANLFVGGSGLFDDIYRNLTQSLTFTYSDLNTTIAGITYNDPDPTALEGCTFIPPGWNRTDYCEGETFANINDIPNIADEATKNRMTNRWLREYKRQGDVAAAVSLLEAVDTRMTQRKLVGYHLSQGNLSLVDQLLQTLPYSTEEDQAFYDFYDIIRSLAANGQTIFDISPAQKTTMIAIANSRTKTAQNAQALLFVTEGMEFPVEIPDLPTGGGNGSSSTVFKQQNSVANSKVSPIVPNLVTTESYFSHELEDGEVIELKIYDLNGRIMTEQKVVGQGMTQLDSEHLENGIYYYAFLIDGTIVYKDKLMIVK